MICQISKRAISLAMIAIPVVGCTGLLPGSDRKPPQLYEVKPEIAFSRDIPRIRAQLLVETPTASSSLRSSRIAIKLQPGTLDYFADSEWTDVSTNLVQRLLIEAFDNSGKIPGVTREGGGLRIDYMLKSDLREFQAKLFKGEQASVDVRIHAQLVRWNDRDIVASERFEASVPLQNRDIASIMKGFDLSLKLVLKKIVEWSLRRIHRDSEDRPL
ncbi:MAG: ABC-type transport auxiliary lipoprotein family protein [Rhodospirillaceae bacterium]|nr:ABC-type transport auxiliary lipoprotein family protein [Rhodospirillaceae bacterium]